MILLDSFKEIDLDRYAAMTVEMLPGADLCMMVYNYREEVEWANRDDCSAVSDYMARNNVFKSLGQSQNDKRIDNREDKIVACYPIRKTDNVIAGYLVFFVRNQTNVIYFNCQRVAGIFNNIAFILQNELSYIHEVNNLAIELGERYDELSMLHSSDLPRTCKDSHHILSSYIHKCADYLDIDYACILIPERNAFFRAGKYYTSNNPEVDEIIQNVAKTSLNLLQEGLETVAINDKDDPLLSNADLAIDKKILSVPIFDDNDFARAVLVCVNNHNKRDFTYSDRLTVETVCTKVTKHLRDTEDRLTQLYNRSGFEQAVLCRLMRDKDTKHLALINICQFNVINGAYGVDVGDQVLQKLGSHFKEQLQDKGFAGRLESDHFAVFINENANVHAEYVLRSIVSSIHELAFYANNKQFSVEVKCSLVEVENHTKSLSDSYYTAELALQEAKEYGNKNIVVFKPQMANLNQRKKKMSMVGNIKHALEENRFTLYAQNIRSLKQGNDHYELLVRMLDENGDIVPPNDFIPTAEQYNIMSSIDRWVLNTALKMLSACELSDAKSNIKWGINLSGSTMSDTGFLQHISGELQSSSVCPSNLYFEITETAAIENYDTCIAFMNHIHSMGIHFALDDFGSGLSSFSYLKKLPIDYLKIDGSLVKDIVNSELDYTMVSAIAQIANVLGVQIIAEYVENDAIIEKLNELGVDYAQGFGVMKPMPFSEVIESLSGTNTLLQHSSM